MSLSIVVAIGLFLCAVVNTRGSAELIGEIFHPVMEGWMRAGAIAYAVLTTAFWWGALTFVVMIALR